MRNILLSAVLILVMYTQILDAQWTALTLPAGRGGAVNSLCVKGGRLFAGKHEGVYVSPDNGMNWRKINPDVPARYYNLFLRSITATEDYMVVAGGDLDVHISTDDGEHWMKQGLEWVIPMFQTCSPPMHACSRLR